MTHQSDRGTQQRLLEQVRDRLRAKIEILDQSNCMVTDNAIPDIIAPGYFVVTVSMSDGVYPENFFEGGGFEQLTESSQIVITALKQNDTDQPEHLEEHLIEPEGLLSWAKLQILKAMLIEQVVDTSVDPPKVSRVPWMPVRGDGQFFLRNQLTPVSCSYPRPIIKMDEAEQSYLGMELRFSAVWDWEL